jgi:hypothetical protein
MVHHGKITKQKLPLLTRSTTNYDKLYENKRLYNATGVSLRLPLDGKNVQNLQLVPPER